MTARRLGLVAAFLLGVASLLAVELVAVSATFWPPVQAIAGKAAPAAPAPTQQAPERRHAAGAAPSDSAAPSTSSTTEQPTSPARQVPGQRPGTIRLPDGGTARLVRKEVQGPNAVLPVPQNLNEATWWGAGLGAGSGASVFAGHVNWGGRTGPFAELWHVGMGDKITVVDHSGKAWHYQVARILTLGKEQLANRAPELFGQQGAHRIVLVTCGGRWVGGSKGYAQNRVVIAEPAR